MQFKYTMPLSGGPTMAAQVELDRDSSIYTSQDTVTGRLILDIESPVTISKIAVNLSGIAISRLSSRKGSEMHRVSGFRLLHFTIRC